VVVLRADLDATSARYCSGVAVSPGLVVTSASCLTYPPDGEYGDEATVADGPQFRASRSTYLDSQEYDELCDPVRARAPREDGRFGARLGEPVPLQSLAVALADDASRPMLGVDAVLSVSGGSRCNDGVAVLRLKEPLALPEVPARFEAVDHAGEAVVVSGLADAMGRLVRRDASAQVERVTDLTGDELAPPRSLLLNLGTCPFERGGAVFSADSGALIGLVAWGQNSACEASTSSSGTTVATRLAPFRNLLLEAAAAYGQTLFSELPAGVLGDDESACATEPQ
jgi:hypothetical protein